jgi:uncharacterized coiled-coil DUF342 family protein
MVQIPVEWRDALLAENQRLREERDRYRIEADKLLHEYDDLEVENQRLREALERIAYLRRWRVTGNER